MILSFGWALRYRVMQLNWLHFCGKCQLILLKLCSNTINQLACLSYSLHVQLFLYPMYYPGGMKARVGPVQWSKPHSILAPTQDSNPGGRIQRHKRWPIHYHCPQCRWIVSVIKTIMYLDASTTVKMNGREKGFHSSGWGASRLGFQPTVIHPRAEGFV